jgi:hypothetical protein
MRIVLKKKKSLSRDLLTMVEEAYVEETRAKLRELKQVRLASIFESLQKNLIPLREITDINTLNSLFALCDERMMVPVLHAMSVS